MKKTISKVLIVFILLVVLLLTVCNYINKRLIAGNYDTETAFASYFTESFSGNALVIRNESVIEGKNDGLIKYLVADGEKVSNGMVIAEIYDNYETAKTNDMLNSIEEEIKLLYEVKSLKNNNNLMSETLSKQISDNMSSLISVMNNGILSDASNVRFKLLMLLNKKNLAYGKFSGLNERLSKLQEQRNKYQKEMGNCIKRIASDVGYFVKDIDGYEFLSIPNLNKPSYKDYNCLFDIKDENIDTDKYFGKIIKSFEWYVLLKVDKINLDKFEGLDFVNLDFHISNHNNIPAYIVDIKQSNDNKNTIFVLKCNYMSKDLSLLRKCYVDIITGSVYGIFINSDAVRFVEGEKGVFIQDGQKVKFKKIEPLVETDKIIVSNIYSQDKEYLQVFDKIIINGQNLYDGKIIGK